VIRRAFCIVPVQASGIFGQVPLSPAPVNFPSCAYHAARAGALIHLQLRTRLSPLLNYLSRDLILTHPLQSIYLSLIFTSSLSLPFNARSRLNMPVLILLRHRRAGSIEDTHFLASFFTLPPSPWVLLHVRHRPHIFMKDAAYSVDRSVWR